jgi:hypothetical protein
MYGRRRVLSLSATSDLHNHLPVRQIKGGTLLAQAASYQQALNAPEQGYSSS